MELLVSATFPNEPLVEPGTQAAYPTDTVVLLFVSARMAVQMFEHFFLLLSAGLVAHLAGLVAQSVM